MARLHDQFALHPLTPDERATCESMLQHESARVLVMPTHHINELGDMMGFRFTCNAHAPANVLPLVRTMFHGHTLVECQLSTEQILELMSQPARNRQRMLEFLQAVQADCVPASLECVPDNCSSHTELGLLQANGLLTMDRCASRRARPRPWTDARPPSRGQPALDPRGARADRDLPRVHQGLQPGRAHAPALHRVHRGPVPRVRRVQQPGHRHRPEQHRAGARALWLFMLAVRVTVLTIAPAGGVRLAGGLVAPQGLPSGAVPAHPRPGTGVRDPRAGGAGEPRHLTLRSSALGNIQSCQASASSVQMQG